MRGRSLLLGDIRFQFRYGFYFLYLVFSFLYVGLLLAIPAAWRTRAAILMVFSDPAAMGLYFMGAIVLYEKSERVLNSIAISPVKPWEYVMSKLVSIALISTAVALVIELFGGVSGILAMMVGAFLGSLLFSAVGLWIASDTASLNRFVVMTVPAEILINVPAIAWVFGWTPGVLLLHPGVCIVDLCMGGAHAWIALPVLLIWTALAVYLACSKVEKSLQALGGVKL